MQRIVLTLLLAAGFTLSGCAEETPSESCSTASDCASGESCVDGECVTASDTTVADTTADTAEGDTATSDTTTSDTSTGDTTTGDTSAGDTTAGDTTAGDTTAGDTTAGDTTAGDTTPGDTTTGDTSASDTTAADTTSDTAADVATDTAVCGNNQLEGDEACDDGENPDPNCAYGEESCTVCTDQCTETAGQTSFCGDDIVDTAEEACDGESLDGATCESFSYRRGTPTCDGSCDVSIASCRCPYAERVEALFLKTCAFYIDGTNECWGRAWPEGQPSDTFVDYDDGTNLFACGLTDGQQIRCWGTNQVFDLSTVDDTGLYSELSVGNNHVCAIAASDGSISCWGQDGPSFYDSIPSGTGFSKVSVGRNHACALNGSTGAITCWADTSTSAASATNNAPTGTGYIDVSASHTRANSCGINSSGQIECWGTTTGSIDWTPPSINGVTFTQLDMGSLHACALGSDQKAYCWGDNTDQRAVAPNDDFTAVSAGPDHSCGVRTDGLVLCWGANDEGQTDVPLCN